MAIMYPDDIENYKHTDSEREMYEALRDQLTDEKGQTYHVFFSIRWYKTTEQGKRLDSEADFLIAHPTFGFLVIEVKGGIKIEVNNGTWILTEYKEDGSKGRRELSRSPYRQAEESMRNFKDIFEAEFHHKFRGTYGFAVAFPRYSIDTPLAADAPLELTIDLSHMKDLKRRINNIFHFLAGKRTDGRWCSRDDYERFLHVVNKKIALDAAAGALIQVKEKEFAKIEFVQNAMLDMLYHYPEARILGGAGTGKTFIAMKKARRDARAGKSVLFLCCNRELCAYIKDRLGVTDEIDFRTYEDLMREILGDKYDTAERNENGNRKCFDLVAEASPRRYDSIIVDEGQDFDTDMGLSVRSLLKNDKADGEARSELYVFYDVNQNIFDYKADNAFWIDPPPFILHYNIRNTGCIYKYAVDTTGLGEDTISNQLLGVAPEIRRCKNARQGLRELNSIVNKLTREQSVSTRSIVILSDEPFPKSILATETGVGPFDISFHDLNAIKDTEICFKTADQFKGLEADVVIYLKNEYPDAIRTKVERQKEYVALTRARYYLFVIQTRMES